MKEYFYFSIIAILLSYIFLERRRKKPTKRRYPSGDYVLKIVVNKSKRKDKKQIIDVLKRAVFEIAPTLFEDSSLYSKWRSCGEGKVVLIANEEEFKAVEEASKENNIPCHVYNDTLIMVGPGLKNDINLFTGHLKLF